jgi:WD40 repeat protein
LRPRLTPRFPGDNGRIVFASSRDDPNQSCGVNICTYEIYTMNADGSGVTRLTNNSSLDRYPRWSADGSKIVWQRGDQIWTMNADGSNQTHVPIPDPQAGYGLRPTWSPDARKIAFTRDDSTYYGLWVMNADSSGETFLLAGSPQEGAFGIVWSPNGYRILTSLYDSGTNLWVVKPDGTMATQITFSVFDPCCTYFNDTDPDWAPDGGSILFHRFQEGSGSSSIVRANPDGTNLVTITASASNSPWDPAWSPDMSKIAFTRSESSPSPPGYTYEIYTMNPDGSSHVNITNNPALDVDPDWQPIRPPGYARPKSASPNTIRLVPAYEPCTNPNASHGAPLAVASCSPPQQSSDYLTVGSPDANGQVANSVGLLTAKVLTEAPIDLTNGDQSDVELTISITDVRNRQTLADYTGELRASFGLRLTDRLNGPVSVQPATALDTTFGFSFSCAATGAGIGASCSAATSADAVTPGITPEFKRAVWQLGQVRVYDGGADGDADTTGDNTLFAEQGLFVP